MEGGDRLQKMSLDLKGRTKPGESRIENDRLFRAERQAAQGITNRTLFFGMGNVFGITVAIGSYS